jgi:hypothetical protein
VFLSCVFINFIFVFLTSGQDCNSGMQKLTHFRTDMEHNICRKVNNSDVSLGYQFCKNITFILYIIYNVRYNQLFCWWYVTKFSIWKTFFFLKKHTLFCWYVCFVKCIITFRHLLTSSFFFFFYIFILLILDMISIFDKKFCLPYWILLNRRNWLNSLSYNIQSTLP